MDRERLSLAALVCLVVGALGFGSRALFEDSSSATPGSDGNIVSLIPNAAVSVPYLPSATVLEIVLLVVLIASVLISLFTGDFFPSLLRGIFLTTVLVVFAVVVGFMFLQADLTEFIDQETGAIQQNATSGEGGDGNPETPLGMIAILAVTILIGGVVVSQLVGGSERDDGMDVSGELDESVAVGRAAGRAADRIDETTLSNGVFRAWREMTAALDVDDPESTTPAEFADAAVESGMARDDVETLTDLFRDVRYGGVQPTAERERQARETLRHIEETYGTNASTTDPTDHASGGEST